MPPGFARGFPALENGTEYLYKCTDYYRPDQERTLLWNDPVLGIDWSHGDIEPLSPKDRAGLGLDRAETFP